MIIGKRTENPGCIVVVRPAGSGKETKLVLLTALLTVLVCGSAVAVRTVSTQVEPIPVWQIDAFSGLNAQELATFNTLHTAGPEIEMLHNDIGGWPSVTDLASEFIAPFMLDAAWGKNGRLEWTRSVISAEERHIAAYIGRPLDIDVSRSFLLVMLHDHVKREGNATGTVHAPYEVWVHPDPAVNMPSMITDQALISAGWREVVARSGQDEMQRTKGEDFLK